uniref:Uncharacterized protein n=2 Tax=Opuntia streptacantha TaxID=393608 RepID=A0A7C8ZR54_OPUST
MRQDPSPSRELGYGHAPVAPDLADPSASNWQHATIKKISRVWVNPDRTPADREGDRKEKDSRTGVGAWSRQREGRRERRGRSGGFLRLRDGMGARKTGMEIPRSLSRGPSSL